VDSGGNGEAGCGMSWMVVVVLCSMVGDVVGDVVGMAVICGEGAIVVEDLHEWPNNLHCSQRVGFHS